MTEQVPLIQRFSSEHRAIRPPGPHLREWLGLRRDLLGFFGRVQRYGDVVYLVMGAELREAFAVYDPAVIEHVLVTQRQNFVKSRVLQWLREVLGDGLLTSEGEKWRRSRALMAPHFHRRAIPGYATQMVDATDAMFVRWGHRGSVDIGHEMMGLTLHIALDTLFGAGNSTAVRRVGEGLNDVLDYFATGITRLVRAPLWLPTPQNRQFERGRTMLFDAADALIAERRAQLAADPTPRLDLLSLLISSVDESGTGLNNQEVRNEALTLLLAGHETTAQALTYTLVLLDEFPTVQDDVRHEVDTVLAGRTPTPDDLAQLPILDGVVRESLRLYPPAALLGRESLAPDRLGNWEIPAGAQVVIPIWHVHRDPRWYPDPLRMDPTRWIGPEARTRPRFAWMPFGGGNRVCIGEAFAMMELKLVLIRLLQHMRWERIDKRPLQVVPAITTRPAAPVLLRVWPKDGHGGDPFVTGASATSAP